MKTKRYIPFMIGKQHCIMDVETDTYARFPYKPENAIRLINQKRLNPAMLGWEKYDEIVKKRKR